MIIGISGKKQHGKDLTCKLINFHLTGGLKTYTDLPGFLEYYDDGLTGPSKYPFERKLFADKLKDIVCMLIGCTRAQLEDSVFKETPLGEGWRVWFVNHYKATNNTNIHGRVSPLYMNNTEAETQVIEMQKHGMEGLQIRSYILTPRLMMQLIGTECGRQIIHPNIWVNALMSEYKRIVRNGDDIGGSYPNWIITDVRFPNEVKAIKDRGGVVIRVNRKFQMEETKNELGTVLSMNPQAFKIDLHESETSLDDYRDFDFTINNNYSLETLAQTVQVMLEHLKII